MRFKTEGGLAAKEGASSAEGLFSKGVGDEQGGVRNPDGIDSGRWGVVGDGTADA
jgi:hypothetical protein